MGGHEKGCAVSALRWPSSPAAIIAAAANESSCVSHTPQHRVSILKFLRRRERERGGGTLFCVVLKRVLCIYVRRDAALAF